MNFGGIKKSDRNHWIGFVVLVLAAIFAPERYRALIFLGAIWMMLFEISDRLRTHYYLHKRTAESLEKLKQRWVVNEDDI